MTPAAMFTCELHYSINVSSIIVLGFLNINGTNVHDLVLCTKHNNWRKDSETQKHCTTKPKRGVNRLRGFWDPEFKPCLKGCRQKQIIDNLKKAGLKLKRQFKPRFKACR
eukprot:579805-Amphidinium_carterae.1